MLLTDHFSSLICLFFAGEEVCNSVTSDSLAVVSVVGLATWRAVAASWKIIITIINSAKSCVWSWERQLASLSLLLPLLPTSAARLLPCLRGEQRRWQQQPLTVWKCLNTLITRYKHSWNLVKGHFTQMTKIFSDFPLVVSFHAHSFVFFCPCSEISDLGLQPNTVEVTKINLSAMPKAVNKVMFLDPKTKSCK